MTAFIDARVLEIQTRYAHLASDFILLRATDETLRVVLKFDDGTTLRITERWHDDELIRYSYYWLGDENELKVGWDNAPHHHDLAGFPHHKHVGPTGELVSSTEESLDNVVSIIEQEFEN